MNLLPCDQPPAIEIFVKSPDGESRLGKFDSSEPSSTTAVPLNDVTEFQFIVSWISIQTVTITVCFHVCMQIHKFGTDSCIQYCITITTLQSAHEIKSPRSSRSTTTHTLPVS